MIVLNFYTPKYYLLSTSLRLILWIRRELVVDHVQTWSCQIIVSCQPLQQWSEVRLHLHSYFLLSHTVNLSITFIFSVLTPVPHTQNRQMFSCLPKPGSRNSSIPHCDNTAPLHLLCSFKPCRSVSFTPACSEHKVESDVCRMSSGSPPGFPHHSSLFTTRHSSVKHPVLLTGPFILKQTHSTHNLCSA